MTKMFAPGLSPQRRTMLNTHFPIILTAIMVSAALACSSGRNKQNISSTRSALSWVGGNTNITAGTSIPYGATETSATTIMSSLGEVPVVSFNAYTSARVNVGWARSLNGGMNWDVHHATESGYQIPTPFNMSNGSLVRFWLGDTWVANPGQTDVVALTAIIQGTDGSSDVALATSIDDGLHYNASTARISDLVSGTDVDGPSMASPGNGVVYIWWYGNNKHWLRKMNVSGTGNITQLSAPIDLSTKITNPITGMPVTQTIHSTLAAAPGVGGSGDQLFLLWNDFSLPSQFRCSHASERLLYEDINFFYSYSNDGGTSWSSARVWEDHHWPHCLGNTDQNSNRARGAVQFDAVSGFWVYAIGGLSTVDTANNYVGTRSLMLQIQPGNPIGGFWMSLCNSQLCPTGGPCLVTGIPPVGETFCHQFGPSVAAVPWGAISSWGGSRWHDTRDTVNPPQLSPVVPISAAAIAAGAAQNWQVDEWMGVAHPGLPFDTMTASEGMVTPLSANVPWTPTGLNGNTWWGDYEGMAGSLTSNKFYVFWGDDRNGAPTQIFSQVVTNP